MGGPTPETRLWWHVISGVQQLKERCPCPCLLTCNAELWTFVFFEVSIPDRTTTKHMVISFFSSNMGMQFCTNGGYLKHLALLLDELRPVFTASDHRSLPIRELDQPKRRRADVWPAASNYNQRQLHADM